MNHSSQPTICNNFVLQHFRNQNAPLTQSATEDFKLYTANNIIGNADRALTHEEHSKNEMEKYRSELRTSKRRDV